MGIIRDTTEPQLVQDVSTLKQQVNELQNQVTTLKETVTELQTEVDNLKKGKGKG